MVPGLEDRLMEGTDEDVVSIADLVRTMQPFEMVVTHQIGSFKEVSPALDPMILKV
jgi:hypothetical protein